MNWRNFVLSSSLASAASSVFSFGMGTNSPQIPKRDSHGWKDPLNSAWRLGIHTLIFERSGTVPIEELLRRRTQRRDEFGKVSAV